MDAKVNRALESLRSAVDNDDMPAETRAELSSIIDTVERALEADAHSDRERHRHDLRAAAARFDVEHPSLSESLRTVIHSLGSAGL